MCDDYHADSPVSPQDPTSLEYSALIHKTAGFKTRVCGGTKSNYVLVNDSYRSPYEWWSSLEAKLAPIAEGGEIKQIVVLDGGKMYASMESAISGSGGKVDPIPVFDENGTHAQMIFDDVSLNNFEYDYLSNPSGSGHGFQERPWSWDGVDEGETYFNKPAYGPSGKGEVLTISHRPSTFFSTLGFSELSLKDSLGDRVIGVTVRDLSLIHI